MRKLSLTMKLGLGFGTLLVIVSALGFTGYITANRLSEMSDQVNGRAAKKELTASIDLALGEQTSAIRGFLLYDSPEMLQRDEQAKGDFRDSLEKLDKVVMSDDEREMVVRLRQSHQLYRDIADKMIELGRAGKRKEGADLGLTPQMKEARKEVQKASRDLFDLEEKQEQETLKAQQGTESKARAICLLLVSVGLVAGLIVAVLIVRSIKSGVTHMLGLIQEIAANNLAIEDMHITSEDEIGNAGRALNSMKNNLREMIQSIAGMAEHVASASEEISSSANQQAQTAETQKDQASQVATAMQEMASTVMQVSDNSNKAAEASRQAAETARHGGAIVEETLTKMRVIAESVGGTAKKMEELGKSSDQIGRIIGVIDDIADQTNLLALNAAIEAARAGEQGRGFAVVADEVRKLAERTTTATKEIAQMIKNIQDETKTAVSVMEEGTKQVEEGVSSTAKAGESLKEIIQMSEQVGEMITHIATAATEQSSATEQVNNNMDQIARLVKESAVGAQQSAKACQDLSGLALDLQKMVGEFKLDGSEIQRREQRKSGSSNANADRRKAFAAAAN